MQQNDLKFKTWWLLIAVGAIFIAIGVFAFISPFSSYVRLVKYTGVGLLATGAALLTVVVLNKKYPRERDWMQAESILHFLFAIHSATISIQTRLQQVYQVRNRECRPVLQLVLIFLIIL